ncbi:MAG TPA: hypothetical protein VJK03_01645 [Candidatus Nanoarchaeia archaeon]|nr:hypothetical protein [Candidatus Nanoarchaeia archaeon]
MTTTQAMQLKSYMTLPLAQTESQKELWQKLRPVNIPAACDTYKRTMSGSSAIFADNDSCYVLAARIPLNEDGVHGRYIMAGLEKALYPWFLEPVSAEEVQEARSFFTSKGAVRHFPVAAWERVLENKGRMPLDIYALPGGQGFLVKDGKHTPIMSVEGPGALVTHLEPNLEHLYAPIIHATKARLFREATGMQFAEFGYRSDQNINNHVPLMMALYVGAGFKLTSDDQAVLLYPQYFNDIGTVGHEFIMAYQREGISLEEAQKQAYEEFVAANERSALLPDVIDTVKSGLPAILELVKKYLHTDKVIMPRFDSGDVVQQCIIWKRMTLEAGIAETKMVVEDGYTPAKARETKRAYAEAGFNSNDIIVGAGGYFQQGCSRDAASLVYKRSATFVNGMWEPAMKFSDSPGKSSIPGRARVWEKGRTLIVAQAGEEIPRAQPLMQRVVTQGRITYNEDLDEQKRRAERTWNKYETIEYSPATEAIIAQRTAEKEAIALRMQKGEETLA